ncbi:MAG: hypothetical protein BGO12_04310 [Verrucomicrobia bacterium 61-8]|nr:MAG: hypothetical protein BGO12_04310 [Verrucomicrobia bacterium 61-8]
MIDNLLSATTCRVNSGDDYGTGFLIGHGTVLTARHCVLHAINSGEAITLRFTRKSGDIAASARIIEESKELDACILAFDQEFKAKPIPLKAKAPREGSRWLSFGFPTGKFELGHRVAGVIDQVLAVPKGRVDIDVKIDADTVIPDFRGFSGGPIVVDGAIAAMLRFKFGNSLGGISIRALEKFLTRNGHSPLKEAQKADGPTIADRNAFQKPFEMHVRANKGGYLFLEGSHGLGKTTFCNTYKPVDQDILLVGAYSIYLPGSALSSIHRAQPDVFFDWLLTTVTDLITGKGARKEKRTYTQMAAEVAQILESVSDYAAASKKQALIFIDGLNEAQDANLALLTGLVGFLPVKLPPHVTLVLTAPNYALVAPQLSGRVKAENVLSLPPLTEAASLRYCRRKLNPDRAKPAIIKGICERAAGHPLYLHYIIEYVNLQPKGAKLDEFPMLTGPIEQYYRVIWEKIALNGDAVRLLALIARLRWGIDVGLLTKALSEAEQLASPTVFRYIRHLLTDEASTAIYHQSFAAYILGQTQIAEEASHHRLVQLCQKETAEPYCRLNLLYHLSRGTTADRREAIKVCDQAWIDDAAKLAAEPDAVLADIEKALDLVMADGPAVDFFRLLLLAQRVQFRYNVLFAQSAALVAEALITLKRPDEALTYLIRFKSLIVGPTEILVLAHRLIQSGYSDHSLKLLGQLEDRLFELYHQRVHLHGFLDFCSWHIQAIFLGRLAGGTSGVKGFMKVANLARNACRQGFGDQPGMVDLLMSPISCLSNSYFLTFRDHYPRLAEIKLELKGERVPPGLLLMICNALLHFEECVDRYNLSKRRDTLPLKFKDMEELLDLGHKVEERLVVVLVDSLVRFNAPASLVRRVAAQGKPFEDREIALLDKNGVDVDFGILSEDMNRLRTNAFLDGTEPPSPGSFGESRWMPSLLALVRALCCCDGLARRARSDGDAIALAESYDNLKTTVLGPLVPTLAQRVGWANAYAIPEQLLPKLHRQVVELLVDCFPEHLSAYLERLLAAAPDQWGLYTEGFREAAYQVLKELSRDSHPTRISSLALQLLDAWRKHVLAGVENRRELVPELLRLIPLHVHFGKKEEADRLYERVLAVSMGPSWYKEDQLGLMTSTLARMPATDDVSHALPLVAGYLERAAGEMTFQRYVRHEKGILTGEIFRRNRFASGLGFFRRQTCGTSLELMAEARSGVIDKPMPDRGARFPGGALEEQASILQIVHNAQTADWRIRWALLEVFLCGDSRHVDDLAEEFSNLANEAAVDAVNIPVIAERLAIVLRSETARERQGRLSSVFLKNLKPELLVHFAHLASPEPARPEASVGKDEKAVEAIAPENGMADDEVMERHDEGFFLPGVFGRHSAMKESRVQLAKAEAELAAGNQMAAKAEAAALLTSLQKAEWDIWTNSLSDEHRKAESILSDGESLAEVLIRRYAPMVKAEKNTAPWDIARHLIGKTIKFMSEGDRNKLLSEVIEHVRHMVGEADDEINAFGFLCEDTVPADANLELIRFLIWLLDHPHGLRRQRAAALLAWLAAEMPGVTAIASPSAFTNDAGYAGEVVGTILDNASSANPVKLWDELLLNVDISEVIAKLVHVGRMETLRRIAARAKLIGSVSANKALHEIDRVWQGRTVTVSKCTACVPLPEWAEPLSEKWNALSLLGFATPVIFSAFQSELQRRCTPFTVDENWRLERAVAEGFREDCKQPLTRWMGKLHSALNIALHDFVPLPQLPAVEAILRVCNPSLSDSFLRPGENTFFLCLLDAMRKQDFTHVFVENESILLHLRGEFLGRDRKDHSVEALAVVVATNLRRRAMFPPQLTSPFRASETAPTMPKGELQETCIRSNPEPLFFGQFTPAVYLPDFAKLVGAQHSDFKRETWRYSRQHELDVFGKVIQEGSALMIKSSGCKMPLDKKLAWLIWVEGRLVGMVDEQNNQLL